MAKKKDLGQSLLDKFLKKEETKSIIGDHLINILKKYGIDNPHESFIEPKKELYSPPKPDPKSKCNINPFFPYAPNNTKQKPKPQTAPAPKQEPKKPDVKQVPKEQGKKELTKEELKQMRKLAKELLKGMKKG